jgi:hypothetical protein
MGGLMNLRRTTPSQKKITRTAAPAKALTALLLTALSLVLTGCPQEGTDTSLFGHNRSNFIQADAGAIGAADNAAADL